MKTLWACVVAWLVLSLLTWAELRFSWTVLLASALAIGVLYIAAAASHARGWPLFWLLTALYAGIGVINIHVESLVFGIAPPPAIARDMGRSLAQVVLVSAILAVGMTGSARPETTPASHSLAGPLWLRVPIVALSYVVLYLVAGSLILPFVRHFYVRTGLAMPPLGLLLGVQLLRGLIYVAAMVPLMHKMAGHRRHAALVGGLCLSVLGGVAPLLLPVDDVLPPEVRAVHMLEILGSNFLLGVIAAFLLVRRVASPRVAQAVAVPA